MSRKYVVLIFFVWLLTGAAGRLFGQSGVFDCTGIIPGHGTYSSLPEESVDLFTGNLTLRYRDIFIPGPNGLHIEVWRVYNSKILYDKAAGQPYKTVQAYPKSMVGLGWTMHMGMVHNAYSSTPVIEFPDGRREIAFPLKSGDYDWGPYYRITRDFLKYYCRPGYDPKLYFQNGTVWTFGNVASLPLASGSSETVYMVTRIEDPLGNFIDIEYDAQDNLRSIATITDSLGREVRFVKTYQGNDPAKLAEIRIRNAADTADVTYGYTVGSFPNGFYKLTSFDPPEIPPTNNEYNDGQSDNYELTRVTTSFGGVLEYSYLNHSFYFSTTQLDSRVVSQKRITFNAGETAEEWDYTYPTYQGVSSGTATVAGPEYGVSATHYGYESSSANRWRIGLHTAGATSDGSASAATVWTNHEISTTSWWILGVNMGTAKGPLRASVTQGCTGDSTLKREYYYLRAGQTTVKRYGLPTKISRFVNGSSTAKNVQEITYFFEYEAHSGFKDRYMLAFVETDEDKTAAGSRLRKTVSSYFEEDGKWGALKQVKRWKTGETYLIWDHTFYRVSPEYYSTTVDGPGSSGISTMSYKYALEQSVSAPDYLKYTRHIYKYGFVLHEWNQYGGSRSYAYDDLGRVTTIEWRHAWEEPPPPEPPDPPGPFLTVGYDWQDGVNQVVITRGGNTITRHWDGFGRDLGYTETGDGTTLYYLKQLDAEGRIKKETRGSVVFDPEWEDYVYSYQYDALGRVLQITDPVDNTTTIQYFADHTKRVTDPESHPTTYAYNDLPGLPTRLTDAQGHIADYTYDAVGRLTTVVYNSARTHSYAYDPLDNMTSETHPETGTIGYDYDSANHLWRKIWGGTQTNYYYNASGLQINFSGPETVTYGYNEKGAVESVTGSTGWSRTGIAYDDFGHITAETVSIPYLDPDLDPVNLTYAYDGNGRLTETTYPDGKKAIQSFNDLDRPETLRFGQGETPPELIKEASYGPMKLPSIMNFHDVMSSSTTFYANGAPNSYSLMRGATPLYNATYDYNGVGNITTISSTAPSPALAATFVYDSLNRLTSASYSIAGPGASTAYSYQYDAYGNMLTAGAFSKTYDASNRIVGYQYDSRGNLLAGEPGATYEWDSQNRLRVVRDAAAQCVADYRYDDRGRRIASFPPLPDIFVDCPYGSNADFTSSLQTPAYRTFIITNQGLGSLNIGAIPEMDMFNVTQAPASIVPPGQSTEFTIEFRPTSTGDKTATLSIPSDDLDENPYTITLVGTGLLGPGKIIDGDELTLLAPNGGERLEAGSLRPITWTGGERVRDVKLDYSTDNGTTYRTIVERFANVGRYPWQVPEELSGSCLVRICDADGTPTTPVIVSLEFSFRVSQAEEDPQDRPHFVLRTGLPDLRTQTFQVAEVAFAPDGLRGAENLLFNHALGEVQELDRFLGRWHRARITYDLGAYTGSVWVDNEPILSGVPLRSDLAIERPAEISLEPGRDVPIKLWIDDIDVRFIDQSQMGRDPEGVVFRPLFRDNFDRYEPAVFPKEGGWLPGLGQTRLGEPGQGETAEEGAQMLQAVEAEPKAGASGIDDRAYISSARSFKLEASEEEPGTVAKRFSLPERIPYCVSADNFSIIASGGEVQAERAGRLTSEKEIKKGDQRRRSEDEGKPGSGRGRTADRHRPLRPTPGPSSAGRLVSKSSGDVRMLAGPSVGGTFYICAFDGRLLAEYNMLGQLVRDYVYFDGRLVAEYRNGALYHYASDLIGSTRMVTDYAGNVIYSAAHNPYGGVQKTWVTDFDAELKFSGKPRDAESELDFFGPRYYDRSQFRLLSPNPVSAGSGSSPTSHSWNAYSYPANNPWAETYVLSGWMVSAKNIAAVPQYTPPPPEPEIPWWTVSYPWVLRAEDRLWVLIKSSGEKREAEEHNWHNFLENWDKGEESVKLWFYTFDPIFFRDLITISEGLEKEMWGYISGYEYGSDPVMDAYLELYGMSSNPDNPLSFWNPCYVMYHFCFDF